MIISGGALKKAIQLSSYVLFFNLLFITKVLAVETIVIATSRYNSTDYRHLTNDVPCYKQAKYQPITSKYRGAIDIHMLCQLFNAVNFPVTFVFTPAFDYTSAVKLVKQGKADMIAETAWSNLISNKVLKSAPIYKKNEYELGIYTTLEKTTTLKINTAHDFNILTGVSNKLWGNDWKLLQTLKTQNMLSANNALTMFRLVKYNNADFVLWPFYYQSDDMSYTLTVADRKDQQYYKLYPVPNIKLTMPYSRHYILSGVTPRSELIMETLNKGIERLSNAGKIRQLYIDCGFLSDKTKDWKTIELTNTKNGQ